MAAPCTAVAAAAAALAPDNTATFPSISTSSPEISTSTSTAGRKFERTIYDQQVMFRLHELSNLDCVNPEMQIALDSLGLLRCSDPAACKAAVSLGQPAETSEAVR